MSMIFDIFTKQDFQGSNNKRKYIPNIRVIERVLWWCVWRSLKGRQRYTAAK
ncbi:hypothetical protein Thiosp_03566 [Thiorhodovibrio litoralis]|nr:hypothetical protein Thiosp_03566 [Thiorhodovibrio litoralis]